MAVQIISLIIALLAVIAGPIITYIVTKKNLESQFRLTVPIKWLEKLEEAAHSYLFASLEWIEKYRGVTDSKFYQKEDATKEINRMFDAINSAFIKLQLQLDEKKSIQKEILNNAVLIKDIINEKLFDEASLNKLRTAHDAIIEKVKIILQGERSKITKVFR
ncbi:MAG: hypothetical protein IPM14_05165 [bacterium]|nr:hypothetical protein [bacterium]